MDIKLGGMDGMSTVRRLRERGTPCQVVFLTAYPEYVFDAFDLDAVHYLVKPVGDKALFHALDRALRRLTSDRGPVLGGLLRAGRIGAAECYLRSLYDLAPALSLGPATGSPVLDALLTEKCWLAEDFGITLEVDALFPKSCVLSDTDLCILLSNALDNALHAARPKRPKRAAFDEEHHQWQRSDCRNPEVAQRKVGENHCQA